MQLKIYDVRTTGSSIKFNSEYLLPNIWNTTFD